EPGRVGRGAALRAGDDVVLAVPRDGQDRAPLLAALRSGRPQHQQWLPGERAAARASVVRTEVGDERLLPGIRLGLCVDLGIRLGGCHGGLPPARESLRLQLYPRRAGMADGARDGQSPGRDRISTTSPSRIRCSLPTRCPSNLADGPQMRAPTKASARSWCTEPATSVTVDS